MMSYSVCVDKRFICCCLALAGSSAGAACGPSAVAGVQVCTHHPSLGPTPPWPHLLHRRLAAAAAAATSAAAAAAAAATASDGWSLPRAAAGVERGISAGLPAGQLRHRGAGRQPGDSDPVQHGDEQHLPHAEGD